MGVSRVVGLFESLGFGEGVTWCCIHPGVLPVCSSQCSALARSGCTAPRVPLSSEGSSVRQPNH